MSGESLLIEMMIFFGASNRHYYLVGPNREDAEYYFIRDYQQGLSILVYPSIRLGSDGQKNIIAKKMSALIKTTEGEELLRLKDLVYHGVFWSVELYRKLSLLHAVVMESPYCPACRIAAWPRKNNDGEQPIIYYECARCRKRLTVSLPRHLAEQLDQQLK